ncbi:MAG: hypothetical protein Q8L87_01260 [Anaerolineales bacterium]|nr:hypothetical protein [Anaerolineales bacterium]
MQRTYTKYILWSFLLLSAVLGLLRFNSLQLGTSYDDAHYIILAESLSSGQGYQLTSFPRPQVERAFPPGWPLLLTPLTFLFPGKYSILKTFSLVLSLASILLTYGIFSKRLQSPYLEILTGLVALNPLLVGASVTVMSESAYLFFSLLALYLFGKWQDATDSQRKWLIIFVAFAAFYTQLIRTIGIALFIALVVYLVFTRRFREAGITIGVFIAGTLLQGWLSGALISTGYQTQVFNSTIIEKISQMLSNAQGYFNETAAGVLIPVFGARLTSALGNYGLQALPFILNLAIIALIILGLFHSRKDIQLMDVYFIIYIIGILAFWNPKVGSVKARFLIPIIPCLYFYFLQGVSLLTKNKIRAAYAVSIIIAFTLLGRSLQDWRNPIMNQTTDLSIGARWVAENAPSDAIVMVNEPVPAYVHVRRKTINFPKQGQGLKKYLDNQGIDYIIIAPLLQSPRSTDLEPAIRTQILPTLEADPETFIVVYSNLEYNVTVYQYNSGP